MPEPNKLKNLAGYLPVIIAKALTDSLFGARKAVQAEIRDAFDRPTPYVINGVLVEQIHCSGSVYLSDQSPGKNALSPSQVLAPHIKGGMRSKKPSEAGFFSTDMWFRPGPAAKLDQYGNISAGEMRRILSAARLAENSSGYMANQTARSRKMNKGAMGGVYVIPGVGIFQHQAAMGSGGRRWATKYGGRGEALIWFMKQPPQYEGGRFGFYDAVRIYFAKNWARNFSANVRGVLSSMR